MENNFTVYCHISPNGKKYVGITSAIDASMRWGNKGRRYNTNEYFYRAIQKYGWDNFEHIILASNLSKDWACKIEVDLIRRWNLQNSCYGYNTCPGGNLGMLGVHHTENAKKKISISGIGRKHSIETREKISLSLTGRHLSMETRAKLSTINKNNLSKLRGRHLSEEHKKKLSEVNKGKHLSNATRRKISEAELGKTSHTKGLIWINNGIHSKMIKPNDIDAYLLKDYKLGRK